MRDSPLWTPSDAWLSAANLTRFMAYLRDHYGAECHDYSSLYEMSLREMSRFWEAIWHYTGVIGSRGAGPAFIEGQTLTQSQFFPGAALNFAENLLRRRGSSDAIVFRNEAGIRCRISHDRLWSDVARLSRTLEAAGVGPGDRVAAMMPNVPETVIAMLATTARGGVWSSCSPDFGLDGLLERFAQIDAKVLFCADAVRYRGKEYSLVERGSALSQRLDSLVCTIVVPCDSKPLPALSTYRRPMGWDKAVAVGGTVPDLHFERVPFASPLYILYSSGTTGPPKCIVHSVGGTLLQHLKEHQLQSDIKAGDRVFYYTTCGWMMWNWLVSALASEATLLLYDGAPMHPDPGRLLRNAAADGATFFGTSAKYLDALRKSGIVPAEACDLDRLRMIASTGSPLAAETFDYVYRSIKDNICLASISGGTDIVGCFVGGNPLGPVWRGEIQTRCLGMAVDIFDDAGQPAGFNKGELVCTKPFPSMPIGFWNDIQGRRYQAAYFERFPGVWCHGDYASRTMHDGLIIYGRSDATLNPGGVRIGTAEIYREVDRFAEIEDSIVIGQTIAGNERIVLFVKMRDENELSPALSASIRKQVRKATTSRHVPAAIIAVDKIPRTKSGKRVEVMVRDLIAGKTISNKDVLADPKALDEFIAFCGVDLHASLTD